MFGLGTMRSGFGNARKVEEKSGCVSEIPSYAFFVPVGWVMSDDHGLILVPLSTPIMGTLKL